jgi:hypothetical protein
MILEKLNHECQKTDDFETHLAADFKMSSHTKRAVNTPPDRVRSIDLPNGTPLI